ncbi:Na+/H+ antiporter NhaC family protein [uncultured Prevotella sp.]|uniref:Na+/H+ antiporter NhaC family protein n=1 Tax=uncultured Prevotella sp. TaxID=159272 RepID=UPI002598D033|nr:Na+/H+ antiporter NhaC family protein [uncultured Prevotella sp.]
MKNIRKYILSITPVAFLIVFLAVVIRVYGIDALSGPSQLVLIVSTGIAVLIAILFFHKSWKTLEAEINHSIGSIGSPIVILLLIGLLSGTWMVSGIVPMLIYYGMQIINPHVFLITSCLISAIVSVMTGSSWTTVATIGVALMGIGKAEGFSDGWTAGAILSGAYFGDKMSPLSDTTVLASSLCGTPLFTHIKYMTITTVPAFTITLLIFLTAGFLSPSAVSIDTTAFTTALSSKFDLSPWLLLVPVATGAMIYKKLPAIIVLFASSVLAIVFAVIFQPQVLAEVSGVANAAAPGTVPSAVILFKGAMVSCFGSTSVDSGFAPVNALLATRGMAGMLNTVWIILCAICFGGVLKASGMLANIVSLVIPLTRTRVGLVASTVVSGIFFNATAADQFLSIMLNASMFGEIYRKEGYEPRLLSRSIEDSSTVTSVLIPWSTCGMTQSTVLNVPTLTYLPYCFFNILAPLTSIIVAATGYKIYKVAKG